MEAKCPISPRVGFVCSLIVKANREKACEVRQTSKRMCEPEKKRLFDLGCIFRNYVMPYVSLPMKCTHFSFPILKYVQIS